LDLQDQALIDKINAGDFQAFEALVNRYESKVYRLAMRMLRHQQDAEDALQESFLQVYRGLKSFEGRSNFSTWLFRLATNVCLMKIRHRGTEPTGMVPLEDFLPQHEEGNQPSLQEWPEKPEEILFVDDNEGHIERAQRQGWKTIRYDNKNNFIDQIKKYCPFVKASV